MTVTGIGGIFFRSRDPQARAAWYRETEYGRFVRIHDPEGLPLELWELSG